MFQWVPEQSFTETEAELIQSKSRTNACLMHLIKRRSTYFNDLCHYLRRIIFNDYQFNFRILHKTMSKFIIDNWLISDIFEDKCILAINQNPKNKQNPSPFKNYVKNLLL